MNGRYSRQVLFAGLGPEGQKRIRAAEATIVGVGALGSVLAEMMARAGIGRLNLIDRDYVEASNLQRQSLFTEEDAERGLPKAVAAAARLRAINSDVDVRAVVADYATDRAVALLGHPSLVLDGTDNFDTRFLLNDVCLRAGIPWVYGACVGAHGLALLIRPGVTPCLRCVLGDKPAPGSAPTCDTAGVVSPIVHVIAGLQAAEGLKVLAGRSESFLPGLVSVDLWSGGFDVMDLRGRAPWCAACKEARYDYADAPSRSVAVLCGRDAFQLRPQNGPLDLASLAGRLRAAGDVTANQHLVRFRAAGRELVVFGDGRAIVKGVRDAAEAQGVYARYVGN